MSQIQFDLRGNKFITYGSAITGFVFLILLVITIYQDGPNTLIDAGIYTFGILLSWIFCIELITHKMIIIDDDFIVIKSIFGTSKIQLGDVSGYKFGKGFSLKNSKKYFGTGHRLKYFPEKEFEKWLAKNFTTTG